MTTDPRTKDRRYERQLVNSRYRGDNRLPVRQTPVWDPWSWGSGDQGRLVTRQKTLPCCRKKDSQPTHRPLIR